MDRQMYRPLNIHTDGQMDGQTIEHTDRWMDKHTHIGMHGQTDGYIKNLAGMYSIMDRFVIPLFGVTKLPQNTTLVQ